MAEFKFEPGVDTDDGEGEWYGKGSDDGDPLTKSAKR
jgi:hypothetical protein